VGIEQRYFNGVDGDNFFFRYSAVWGTRAQQEKGLMGKLWIRPSPSTVQISEVIGWICEWGNAFIFHCWSTVRLLGRVFLLEGIHYIIKTTKYTEKTIW